ARTSPPPAPPPSPPTAAGVDRLTALKQLGQLREQGVLTDDEFNAEKARILAS
ncbi:SHOCT domain-containing protein, partial [Rhodococcus sp. WS4]